MQGRDMQGKLSTSRNKETINLKKEAGLWLKEQRLRAGLSQIDLAGKLGLRYYTFISQIENGYGRVPYQGMADWARALGIDPAQFARTLLGYYEPTLYRLLFEDARQ
jgi:transcriptional regulator with XRE-family HTH domain